MGTLRIGPLDFECVSSCRGVAVKGLACREFIAVSGELEAEAVVLSARDEMEMEVENLLARGLSVGDNSVDAV